MKMVLENYNRCTGCGACAPICASHSITMIPDKEGFLSPIIDETSCTNCGLCSRNCPANQSLPSKLFHGEPLEVLAAWHLNEDIRAESSSGGIFTAIAQNILERGGVVVGATLDKQLIVRHILIETISELPQLRRSKYVQSDLSIEVYQKIRLRLLENMLVLFSGTPCQVAGLRQFLRKDYTNLLCCDIICHGTPSPLLWKTYLHQMQAKGLSIRHVSFRDKCEGWSKSGLAMRHYYSDGSEKGFLTSSFTKAFITDICLRNSCYACDYSKTTRVADITLGDYWGISKCHPGLDIGDKGTSLLLVNSLKGRDWIQNCSNSISITNSHISKALPGNPMLQRSPHFRFERVNFYRDLQKSYKTTTLKYDLGKQTRIFSYLSKILRLFDFASYRFFRQKGK